MKVKVQIIPCRETKIRGVTQQAAEFVVESAEDRPGLRLHSRAELAAMRELDERGIDLCGQEMILTNAETGDRIYLNC